MVFCFSVNAQTPTPVSLQEEEQRTEKLRDEILLLKKLKVSGYIQGQYQYGQEAASLKVGGANENPEKSYNRIGIRRGRIKFQYDEGIASGVFQLDLTENGIHFKDVYLNIKDPWSHTSALRVGVFDRPFGYEISYSSSRRESPERSTIFQTLFPEERDLGAMFILQPLPTSPFHFLKVEAGLFAGNGIKKDTDSKKDFIGHFSAAKTIGKNSAWGAGLSYYNGSVYQGTENVYKMQGRKFVLDADPGHKGGFAKREYIGLHARLSLTNSWGKTEVRGEYLFGQQPGTLSGSKSPNASSLPEADVYIRDFRGGYLLLVQDIGKLPFSAVLKYDWYDPNTDVSGNDIGLNETTSTDLSMHTIGGGILWYIYTNLRLQAYYEINKNEKTSQIERYKGDVKDNVFTLRLQYKF
ncbi:hypothetical protein D0T51_06680 [Parabacteroides sp. 52]|nr:hypothetical protein [Parabacteroides sp. 52]